MDPRDLIPYFLSYTPSGDFLSKYELAIIDFLRLPLTLQYHGVIEATNLAFANHQAARQIQVGSDDKARRSSH